MIGLTITHILFLVGLVLLVGGLCAGLFLHTAKSHGLRVAVPPVVVSLILLFLPLTNVNLGGYRGYHLTAVAVLLFALVAIWQNLRSPVMLLLPVVTIVGTAYVWANWPPNAPAVFSPPGPEGFPGLLFLAFNLGGAASLAFVLLVHCNTPLMKKTET